jgi:ketosteroid isomerase-like protein
MKRLPVAEEDRRSVADWYARWSGHVAHVDFKPVRAMFAEDAIAFGTKVEVVTSQPQLEAEQWRSVWPSIEDFRFDTSILEVVTSPDRLMAMGALIFRSTGLHPDGQKFERNGRATVTLMRTAVGAPWICTHSHISLKPGTPGTSHGQRPEKV